MSNVEYCGKCYPKGYVDIINPNHIYCVIDMKDPTAYCCKCEDIKKVIISEDIPRKRCIYYHKCEKENKEGLLVMYNGKGSFWPGWITFKLRDIPHKYLLDKVKQ